MDADLNHAAAILGAARNADLLPELRMQLNKDFQRAGLPAVFPEAAVSDADLIRLLQERLYRILMEDFDGYLNLMYAVDVPQRIFRELRVTDAVEVARQMAAAVLGREWQKVSLRAGHEPGA